MKNVLAGLAPPTQGAILAELLSMWLAGHDPAVREEALAMHLATVRDLIPLNDPRKRP
jgi:hypothetical protein